MEQQKTQAEVKQRQAQTAGFTPRLVAYIIDLVPILTLVSLVAYFYFGINPLDGHFSGSPKKTVEFNGLFYDAPDLLPVLIGYSSFLVWLIYCALMESGKQQGTLGKTLLGIKVTDLDGRRLSFSKSLQRNLLKIISFIPLSLGFLAVALGSRSWHDGIAKTQVSSTAQKQNLGILTGRVLLYLGFLLLYLGFLPSSGALLSYLYFYPVGVNGAQTTDHYIDPISYLGPLPHRFGSESAYYKFNTSGHTAKILDISSDTQGEGILTVCAKGISKQWDAKTGELVHSNFGLEFADRLIMTAKFSPDGKLLAIKQFLDKHIFSAEDGKLKYPKLPRSSGHDEFSPDNKYFVASYGDSLSIFRTSNFKLIKNGYRGYPSFITDLAFASDGRLAIACEDKSVHLLSKNFTKMAENTKGDAQPFSLVFSPDSRLLAISYQCSSLVKVYDANTLDLLYQPDTTGLAPLSILLFSDGKLIAANTKKGRIQIRVWEDVGQGSFKDFAPKGSPLQAITALPDGRLAYGGLGGDWGVLDIRSGKQLVYKDREITSFDFFDNNQLRVNENATEISVTPQNCPPFLFDLKTMSIGPPDTTLSTTNSLSQNIHITDWEGKCSRPKLNGKEIKWEGTNKTILDVIVSENQEKAIFITEYPEKLFIDTSGNILGGRLYYNRGHSILHDCPRNIQIAKNGIEVTTWGSTIQWGDGAVEAMLFLYVHPDHSWVLWTNHTIPQYISSPGGEDLLQLRHMHGSNPIYFPLSKVAPNPRYFEGIVASMNMGH